MITALQQGAFTAQTSAVVAYGLASDTKPTEGIANGSTFIEMDTGTVYFFDGEGARWLVFGGGA